MKIAILASVNGSNPQALIDQLHLDSGSGVEIVVATSDRPKTHALHRAKKRHIQPMLSNPNASAAKISEIIEG